MKEIRKQFKNLKIGQKLLICNVGIILIMTFLMGVCGYLISRDMIFENSRQQSEELMEQLGDNYGYAEDTLEELLTSQIYNPGFSALLRKDTGDMNTSQKYDRGKEIKAYASNLINFNQYIDNVLISDNYGNIYYTAGRGEWISPEEYEKCLNREAAYENWGAAFWTPYRKNEVMISKLVFDYENMKPIGSIAVGIDTDYFSERYENIIGNGSGIAVFNKSGEILLASDRRTEEIAKIIKENYPEGQGESEEIYYQNNKYISIWKKTSDSRISVMNVLSQSEISSGIYKKLMLPFILLGCAAILFSVVLALMISGQISRNVKILLEYTKKLGKGDFSGKIEPECYDEVGMLGEEFNNMSLKIQKLLKTVAQERIQKKNSQLKAMEFEYDALQAKINPHFLYNTLESISSLAKIKGQEKISESIYFLGEYLRETISNKKKFVTLEEELENVCHYLEIQKLSYGDRIQAVFQNEECTLEMMVPKLILQPLVENAILHGLEGKVGKGHICVFSRCFEKKLLIEIKDDGVGMTEERIQAVMENKMDFKPGHTKVGIWAVHKRIQILYGDMYGVSIKSEENKGTSVIVQMPVKFEGEE